MKICYVILVGLLIGGCQIDAVEIKEKELSHDVQIIAEAVKEALDGHQADIKTDNAAPKKGDKTDAVAIKEKEAEIIAEAVAEAMKGHQVDVKSDDAAPKEGDTTDAVAIKKTGLNDQEEIIAEAVEKALDQHLADVKVYDAASEDDDEMLDISEDAARAALEKELEEADDDNLHLDDTQDEDVTKHQTQWWGRRRRRRRRRWFRKIVNTATTLGVKYCCDRYRYSYCCDRAGKKDEPTKTIQ